MAGIDDVTARGCIAIEWRAIADARASSSRSSRTLGKEPHFAQTPLRLVPCFRRLPRRPETARGIGCGHSRDRRAR